MVAAFFLTFQKLHTPNQYIIEYYWSQNHLVKNPQSSKGCDGIRNFKALLPAYLGYWFLRNNSNTLLTLMSHPCVIPKMILDWFKMILDWTKNDISQHNFSLPKFFGLFQKYFGSVQNHFRSTEGPDINCFLSRLYWARQGLLGFWTPTWFFKGFWKFHRPTLNISWT